MTTMKCLTNIEFTTNEGSCGDPECCGDPEATYYISCDLEKEHTGKHRAEGTSSDGHKYVLEWEGR